MVNHTTLSEDNNTQIIKKLALEAGFLYCGISKAGYLDSEAANLDKWLTDGRHGQMGYMANHYDKRLDPTKLVDGAKTVVTLLYNYFPSETLPYQDDSSPRISKYAYGEDYHNVIKDILRQLMVDAQELVGDFGGRCFVDSAPILEKAWAVKAGAGWLAKNGNIIRKQTGSFFFLAEMIIDLPLRADGAVTNHCGSCTACIDACPTNAIYQPYKVDASRCISYLTIELKDAIPSNFKGQLDGWAFGCDVCQDVCPWNRFSIPQLNPLLSASDKLKSLARSGFNEITEQVFKDAFGKSALTRTKLKGLRRNLDFLKEE